MTRRQKRRRAAALQGGLTRNESGLEALVADLALVGGLLLELFDHVESIDPFNTLAEGLEQAAHDEARVVGAEAEVRAEAEGDVGVRAAVEADLLR